VIRRLGPAVVFLAGVAAAAVLAVHAGLPAILRSIAEIGWARLAIVCAVQMGALAFCAWAWERVSREASFAACFAARWIRDGASNLVAFIPAIGETISGRALTLFSAASAGEAAASTVVDVAVEALAQALYTVVGLLILLTYLHPADAIRWLLIVAAGLAPVLVMYGVSRHPGALEFAERWGEKIGAKLGLVSSTGALKLAATVHGIYQMRGRTAAAFALHMLGWGAGAIQVWVAARALDHPLGLVACVALQSLVSAARSAFFLVPWAAGVQEGGFLLVGAALGLPASEAIALSLILRARDVLIGAPAMLVWCLGEGRRRLRAARPT
jgi:putative membrane protein